EDRRIRIAWYAFIAIATLISCYYVLQFLLYQTTINEALHVLGLGVITGFRVFIMIILCSMIWVPLGIRIGLQPRLAEIVQPIAQILSAFPANLFYPFIVLFIATYQLNTDIWLTPLMILGSQWYILFNVIAGAASIPKDLLQATDNFAVTGWLRWKRLLLPAIFPFYVTGAITAAGGAWNASIVAEVVSWGHQRLVATGLGAYITNHTVKGDFQRVTLGVGMMCLLVLIINRLVFRPLYNYASNHFIVE
ncbi:MAG TPA: ABC transporter permease subunit, partial [Myxococcota bacterium]|nr:ABC transporter permease subunit [Myxococcota bacterium]